MKNVFYKSQTINYLTAKDNSFLVLFEDSFDFMSIAYSEPCTEGITLISKNKNIIGRTVKYTDMYNCVDDNTNIKYLHIDLYLYREIFGFKIPIFPVVETYIYEYKKNMNFLKKDLENSK